MPSVKMLLVDKLRTTAKCLKSSDVKLSKLNILKIECFMETLNLALSVDFTKMIDFACEFTHLLQKDTIPKEELEQKKKMAKEKAASLKDTTKKSLKIYQSSFAIIKNLINSEDLNEISKDTLNKIGTALNKFADIVENTEGDWPSSDHFLRKVEDFATGKSQKHKLSVVDKDD